MILRRSARAFSGADHLESAQVALVGPRNRESCFQNLPNKETAAGPPVSTSENLDEKVSRNDRKFSDPHSGSDYASSGFRRGPW
jgi:hypothetical protein